MMNPIPLDLSKLHGFRLLAQPTSQPSRPVTFTSLPEMLGSRLGAKTGIVKRSTDGSRL